MHLQEEHSEATGGQRNLALYKEVNKKSNTYIYVVYLFKILDLVLQNDAVGAIRLCPRKGDAALPCEAFPHHTHWGGSCMHANKDIKTR